MMLTRTILTLLIIPLFLGACSTAALGEESRDRGRSAPAVLIEGVPFFPQETYQCGPASMAGVMGYLGVSVTPEAVAKEIYSSSARGTLTIDMILYAQDRGLAVRQYPGSWEDLRLRIREGDPLIVLVDYGLSVYQVNHFMVVVGYNEGGVIANSGGREREFIEKERFLDAWEKTRFWTLLIQRQPSSGGRQTPE